jgi:hypothetical protein
MSSIFIAVYSFFIFLFSLGAIFVLYHLLRYSLDKTLGLMGAVFFGVVFSALVIVNISFFTQINPEKIFNTVNQSELLPTSKFTPQIQNPTRTNPW